MEVGFHRGASLQWRLTGCDLPAVECSESISAGAGFCVSSLSCAFNALACEMICTLVGVGVVF